MAEGLKLKVACHACGNIIEGTARYGSGHYITQGVEFEFVATGKIGTKVGHQVTGEVTCVCPKCNVKNKYLV
jgi:hypothetical protein